MPIPVHEDHFAAQVVFKGDSGAPEDVYTNTFYFHNETIVGTTQDIAEDLRADLEEFYTVAPTGIATPLVMTTRFAGTLLSPDAEVRVYDLGQPAPRYPIVLSFPHLASGASPLPQEVAACLSLVAGENQPRKRGRLYLGPLSTNAIDSVAGAVQIRGDWRSSVLASAKRLIDKPNYEWVQYSPTANQMNVITGAWFDNAFDTIRKRGVAPSQRFTIGTYLGQAGEPVVQA